MVNSGADMDFVTLHSVELLENKREIFKSVLKLIELGAGVHSTGVYNKESVLLQQYKYYIKNPKSKMENYKKLLTAWKLKRVNQMLLLIKIMQSKTEIKAKTKSKFADLPFGVFCLGILKYWVDYLLYYFIFD